MLFAGNSTMAPVGPVPGKASNRPEVPVGPESPTPVAPGGDSVASRLLALLIAALSLTVQRFPVLLVPSVAQRPAGGLEATQSVSAAHSLFGGVAAKNVGPFVPALQNGLVLSLWVIPGAPTSPTNTSVVPDSSFRRKACL